MQWSWKKRYLFFRCEIIFNRGAIIERLELNDTRKGVKFNSTDVTNQCCLTHSEGVPKIMQQSFFSFFSPLFREYEDENEDEKLLKKKICNDPEKKRYLFFRCEIIFNRGAIIERLELNETRKGVKFNSTDVTNQYCLTYSGGILLMQRFVILFLFFFPPVIPWIREWEIVKEKDLQRSWKKERNISLLIK